MKPKKPVVGPVTKKEAMKSAPKVPLTQAGKDAKKKKMLSNIAAIGSSIAGTIGMIAADARLARGGRRIGEKDRLSGSTMKGDPSIGQKWRAGKNKKTTKK